MRRSEWNTTPECVPENLILQFYERHWPSKRFGAQIAWENISVDGFSGIFDLRNNISEK